MSITRRKFITKVAQYGGSACAAMLALKLLDSSIAGAFSLSGSGKGKRVIILGAGTAGMAAAYELGKVGYDCQILEARNRAGGRCWTVRRGDEETEVGGTRQVAGFEPGLYFNPGPARIPQHHITLNYCKEFGIPIEVFTNLNEAAYYYNESAGSLASKRVRIREAKADMRGHTSELLAKAIHQDELDLAITSEDKEKMVEFLRREGDLSPDLFYKGSSRRGYSTFPGASLEPGPGKREDPFDLKALIQSGFGNYFSSEYSIDQQMTMFEPVGGIDQIAKAFEQRLSDKITYGAEVKEIRKTANGVRITYADRTGRLRQVTGDFCICTIPLPVLKGIPSDLSPQLKEAIAGVTYAQTGKSGLQFARRFWEDDDRIFGGITRTNLNITQIFYPSHNYYAKKGILVGHYNFEEKAVEMGNLAPAARIERALYEGSKIHPQYPKEFETGFAVAWHKIRYSLGGWASYTSTTRERYYPTLNQPDGPIYLAGEHLSYLTGWIAGALESAQKVATAIHRQVLSGT